MNNPSSQGNNRQYEIAHNSFTPQDEVSNVSLPQVNIRYKRKHKPYKSDAPQTLEAVKQTAGAEARTVFLSDNAQLLSPKQRFSSWFMSAVFHLVIIVILAFLFFPLKVQSNIEAIFSTEVGDQLDVFTNDEGNLNPTSAENYVLTVPEELRIDDLIVFEEQELPFEQDSTAPIFDQSRIQMNDMLSGRTDPGIKNDLLAKYGGTKSTQDAVEAGLKWLKKNQQKDGSWSLLGPYRDGVNTSIDNQPAATALALLAFQGNGNTRTSGEYSLVVKRGWNWLSRRQAKNGNFTPESHSSSSLFYTHALCTLALCELLTLEKKNDPQLRKQAKLAVDYLIENQHKKLGGWKYEPQESSDLSVTGWCLMALKTAEMANIRIPSKIYDNISKFLDSVQYDNGSNYVYELVNEKILDSNKRLSMTATGLMCREFLGWASNTPALLRGAQVLISDEHLISFPKRKLQVAKNNLVENTKDKKEEEEEFYYNNVYGWYSTSTALKGLGPYNKYWRRWNTVLSRELPQNQEPDSSSEYGSWDPQYDEYAFGGGRLYVTCLSILCLEVYYRYMPLYK